MTSEMTRGANTTEKGIKKEREGNTDYIKTHTNTKNKTG